MENGIDPHVRCVCLSFQTEGFSKFELRNSKIGKAAFSACASSPLTFCCLFVSKYNQVINSLLSFAVLCRLDKTFLYQKKGQKTGHKNFGCKIIICRKVFICFTETATLEGSSSQYRESQSLIFIFIFIYPTAGFT